MSNTLTKLQPGHIVLFAGARHRVTLVNECRARIVPMEKVQTEVEQIIDGKKVVVATFSKYGVAQNISPNSEIEIIGYEKPQETEATNAQQLSKPVQIEDLPRCKPAESLPRRGRGRPRKSTSKI